MSPYDVVIPLFNGAETIPVVIDGLRRQTQRPRSIILVDDGSTDGAREALATACDLTVVGHPGKGANAARAFGVSRSTAPYVAVIDQDDAPCPWHFEALVRALDDDVMCAAAAGRPGAKPKAAEDLPDARAPSRTDVFDPWSLFPFYSQNPSALLIRRRALDQVGGWPTQFTGVADLYILLRLSERYPLRVCDRPSWWVVPRRASYSGSLRRSRPLFYFGQRALACRDALAHRVALTGSDDRSARRLDVHDAFEKLLACLVSGDHACADDGDVRLIATRLETEDQRYQATAFGSLRWHLEPLLRDRTVQERLFRFVVDRWPRSAPNTLVTFSQCMVPKLPGSVTTRAVLARPLRRQRWTPFILATKPRLARARAAIASAVGYRRTPRNLQAHT